MTTVSARWLSDSELIEEYGLTEALAGIDPAWTTEVAASLTVVPERVPIATVTTDPPELLTEITQQVTASRHRSSWHVDLSQRGPGSASHTDPRHMVVADLIALVDDTEIYIGTEVFTRRGTTTQTRIWMHALPDALIDRLAEHGTDTEFDMIIRPNPAAAERYLDFDHPMWDGPEVIVPVTVW